MDTSRNSTPAVLAEALSAVIKERKHRWRQLMKFNEIGAKIVSWTEPGSRSLDSFVRLLMDRCIVVWVWLYRCADMRAHGCKGACVHGCVGVCA